MRIIILITLICILVFFGVFRFLNPQLNQNSILDRIQHPFDTRLRFRIGEIDPKFNMSHDQLLKLSHEAADIWLLGTNKQYFIYDPKAQLTINLIYDERQAESQLRLDSISKIEKEQYKSDTARQQLDFENHKVEQLSLYIERLQSDYETHLKKFNTQVEQYNLSSPPRSEAQKLKLATNEKLLNREREELERQILIYNQTLENLQQQVTTFNQKQSNNLHMIEEYNATFKARLFDKGEFNGREINIYQFESKDDLRITIAHEFGHALGLNHSDDPQSLMYPILEKQNFKNFHLTPADLNLLNNMHR